MFSDQSTIKLQIKKQTGYFKTKKRKKSTCLEIKKK